MHGVVSANIQHALLLLQHHGGECGNLAVALVELHQIADVHIAYAVAIGHHEGLVTDVGLHAFDAPAGHGV